MTKIGRLCMTGAVCVMVALLCGSCASSKPTASSAQTLQSAADATAKAHSFTLSIPGADIVYQAPDRIQQVEHGEAQAASGTNGGPVSSSGPFAQTITKIYIGDQLLEADTPDGATPEFSATRRCASDQNAAEVVLRLLRAIATTSDVQRSGDTYTFRIADQGGNAPTSGTATVSEGLVRTLTFAPSTETVTIGSVNAAPPVTEPGSSTPANESCSS